MKWVSTFYIWKCNIKYLNLYVTTPDMEKSLGNKQTGTSNSDNLIYNLNIEKYRLFTQCW